jgi:chloramphenicol 3-O phosphotransferase
MKTLPPHIIYLNGPSSSGKSTLTRALQNVLPAAYLRIGIDQMIGMMPEKLNDWREGISRTPENSAPGFCWDFQPLPDGTPTHRIVRGPEGIRVADLFHQIARTMVLSGYSIIIDDVALEGSKDITRWRTTLEGFPALWIGLTAPIDVLEERERTRGDRAIGSSRIQAELVHNYRIRYDYFFDTAKTSLEQIVQEIVAACAHQKAQWNLSAHTR